jgi:hypothetical protein
VLKQRGQICDERGSGERWEEEGEVEEEEEEEEGTGNLLCSAVLCCAV